MVLSLSQLVKGQKLVLGVVPALVWVLTAQAKKCVVLKFQDWLNHLLVKTQTQLLNPLSMKPLHAVKTPIAPFEASRSEMMHTTVLCHINRLIKQIVAIALWMGSYSEDLTPKIADEIPMYKYYSAAAIDHTLAIQKLAIQNWLHADIIIYDHMQAVMVKEWSQSLSQL